MSCDINPREKLNSESTNWSLEFLVNVILHQRHKQGMSRKSEGGRGWKGIAPFSIIGSVQHSHCNCNFAETECRVDMPTPTAPEFYACHSAFD